MKAGWRSWRITSRSFSALISTLARALVIAAKVAFGVGVGAMLAVPLVLVWLPVGAVLMGAWK